MDENNNNVTTENSLDESAPIKTKKKLTPVSIAAIAIVCVLVIAFSIFLPLYLKSNKGNRELYANEQIKITAFDETIGTYSIDDLLKLEGVNEVEFSATYDTSNSEPVQKTYTGIELNKILFALDIDLTYAHNITFKASDGTNKVYSVADVTTSDNVYIAYLVDGKAFNKGIKATAYKDKAEDGGPFVIIKVSDAFSQNRCKLFTEVEIV